MLSVIIPNYNHSKYLKQRIDSVLSQTYQNFEVIILDDCSTDNSKAIIESFRNHPKIVHIVYNEINSGSTFKQWQKGIELAKGDYVWMAESDDYAESFMVQSLMEIADSNPSVGLIYCGSNLVDEVGNSMGEIIREVRINKNNYYINSGDNESEKHFLFHPIVPNASAVIFKKKNFFKVNPSYKSFKICGDWLFWMDICFDNFIAYLPQKLNYFRQSSTSVSRSPHVVKNHLKIFQLERLQIMVYIHLRANHNCSKTNLQKSVAKYLYNIFSDSIAQKLTFDRAEKKQILQSLVSLTASTYWQIIPQYFKALIAETRIYLSKMARGINA